MASGGEYPGPSDVRSQVPTLGVDRSHLMQGSGVHPHDDVQRGGLQQLGAGDGEEEIQRASQPERIALHERCWLSTGDSTGRRVDGWNIWVGVDNDVTGTIVVIKK
uniref:Uncharacterized protein n=1 Tax=Oryza rufipogon TaxID=4529 RepID=A0A0E0PXX9_ORYRU